MDAPTQRFTNRVENYRRYRPGYPLAVTALIQETVGLSALSPIADIGSGTGIFTRNLLEAGFEVSAVEPNDAMRAVAEIDLKDFPGFHSVPATAEQTGLPAHHFSALTSAQAFHWFKREPVREEFSRILQPNGWVFLIWNERKPNGAPFDREYEALLATLGQAYEGVRDRWGGKGLPDFFRPGSYQTNCYDNPQPLTWEELRGRFLSSSYVPAEDDPRHVPLLQQLEHIFQKHQISGQVRFEQQTCVYFGQL